MLSIPRRWRVRVLAASCLLLLGGDVAPTRTITLRWKQDGPAAGFLVYQRTFQQPWSAGLDVGLPKTVDGFYVHELEVSNLDATWVAVSAYDAAGRESAKSKEKVYLLDD